ncbi:pyrimidine dimer DNA glycosylase/endonuclease V [Rhodobacter sp.]
MTRINCIPPHELSPAHLIAEYRELPRIFGLVRAAISRGETPDDPRNPEEYRLGAGHVRFFYPRLGWLLARQVALVAEMRARGYAPGFDAPQDLIAGIPPEWQADWQPTPEALAQNRARIAARLAEAAARRAGKAPVA